MTGVVFEDPPGLERSTAGWWLDVLAVVQQRPGEWARIEEGLTLEQAHDRKRYGRCGLTTNRRPRRIDPSQWEFKVGEVDGLTGRYRYGLWARFVGGDDG